LIAAIGENPMAAFFCAFVESWRQRPGNFLSLAARNPHSAAKCDARAQ
jgi:hypothetical protein